MEIEYEKEYEKEVDVNLKTKNDDTFFLKNICETIENMSKFNQIEILKILKKHKDVILNENKNGIHINLTELNEEIINELLLYTQYVTTQEYALNTIEKQKETYKNKYFSKDIKDTNKII